VKLRSASILNNHYNVEGLIATTRFSSIDFPLPLADGNYTGEQFAFYLQQRLNSTSAASNWTVYFNAPALKYYIQFNNTSGEMMLKFNSAMKTFTGFNNDLTFPPSVITAFESDVKVKTQAGYYRLVSNSLSSNSLAFDDNQSSGVVAIIPINSQFGEFTTYNNEDNFYISTIGEQTLFNFIDIHLYLEDTELELNPAVFQLNFQFI
jgi:hypothetical protein